VNFLKTEHEQIRLSDYQEIQRKKSLSKEKTDNSKKRTCGAWLVHEVAPEPILDTLECSLIVILENDFRVKAPKLSLLKPITIDILYLFCQKYDLTNI